MCTRFYIDRDEPAFTPIVSAAQRSPLYNEMLLRIGRSIKESGEIFPTDIVPVLASNQNGRPAAYPMRWGVHMADGTPLFNARSETASIKSFFKADWERRRCIVPASFYYEWKKDPSKKDRKMSSVSDDWKKDLAAEAKKRDREPFPVSMTSSASDQLLDAGKYAIQPKGSSATWLCGIYRMEDGLPHFVILTREPSEDLRRIHNRMPLILDERHISEWIRPGTDPSALLGYALTDMVFDKAE